MQTGVQTRAEEEEEVLVPRTKEVKPSSLPVPALAAKTTTARAEHDRERLRVLQALRRSGMYGRRAEKLSERVDLEHALAWERWCAYARSSLSVESPAGIAMYRLEADPEACPDDFAAVEDWEKQCALQCGAEENEPISDGPLEWPASSPGDDPLDSASTFWFTALGELQLQMTRATFDTWVRATRAVSYDATTGVLVVRTHNPYAKEWPENRLNTTIQRTTTGIAGRAVEVRYEVNGHQ